MKIQTGKGYIPLITLIAIWSISALTSLPGLAVSPILGKLSTIFPHSTELDVQMLTSLPSLLIIPFIMLSGKLTEKVNSLYLLQTGLVVFALCALLYLFASTMWQLILISALLGIGAGLIIPLSTGLISRFFTGSYRVKQFGLSSAISNLTLVLATVLTGYLAEVNWHLPFTVYLLAFASIALSFYLKKDMSLQPVDTSNRVGDTKLNVAEFGKIGINFRHLLQLILFYGLATFISVLISFNIPFLMKEYGFNSGDSGLMISLFFLAIMAPGLFLTDIIRIVKDRSMIISLAFMALGLLSIVFARSEIMIGLGCILTGLGYGVIQPLMYEKATLVAIPEKQTLALAYVMAMNYLAILLCPFIIDGLSWLFHAKSQQFPFLFNMLLTIAIIVFAFLKRNLFVFSGNTEVSVAHKE